MDCSTTDADFGPVISACFRNFDFTLLFEETILSILPSSVFIVLGIFLVNILWTVSTRLRRGHLYMFKLLIAIVSFAIQLAILVEYCALSKNRSTTSLLAAAISAFSASLTCVLSHLEHERSISPSSIIFVYVFIAIVLDVARARTLWLSEETPVICGTFVTGIGTKMLQLVAESWGKRNCLSLTQEPPAVEELSGFLGRSLMLWLCPFLQKGYNNRLVASDLRPIKATLSSAQSIILKPAGTFRDSAREWSFLCLAMSSKFILVVEKCFLKYEFPLQIMISLGWSLASPVIPRLALTACSFGQPFFVSDVLVYFEESTIESRATGYGLLGAGFFIYSGIAVSTAWYWQQVNGSVTKLRRNLVSSIFDKTLKLKESSDEDSRAMTLMIADVHGAVSGLTNIHEIWASLVETVIAIWLLYRQVGLACLPMIGLVLICVLATSKLATLSGTNQQAWFAAMQKRLGPTSKLLNSFKAVKMLGDNKGITRPIETLREAEISAARPYRNLLQAAVLLSYCTLTLSPVLVFATYVVMPHNSALLDNNRLFVSLILISLLAAPLVHLFQVIPSIGGAKGCIDRIQAYLSLEERIDFRIMKDNKPQTSIFEPDFESKGDEKEVNDNLHQLMLSMEKASFRWAPSSRVVLKDISIDVLRGEHIAITGEVGNGKSLLLKAMLGEVEQMQGSTFVFSKRLGYCSQAPWLENITGKSMINRGSTGVDNYIDAVVHACALEDVERLSEYRVEPIGSGGARLSGGQRQRLALARAVFARPEILILDDPFSALDKTTRQLISQRLLGPQGLLRRSGTTVIYSSCNESLLRIAHRVYEVNSAGTLVERTKPMLQADELKTAHNTNLASEDGSNADAATKSPDEELSSNQADQFVPPSGKLNVEGTLRDRDAYKMYFNSVGKRHTAIFLMFSIIFGFALKFPHLWIQWWSDANIGPGSRTTSYWIGIFALLQILPLLTLAGWIWHLMRRVVPNSARGLHSRLLDKTVHASFAAMSNIDVGSLMNRFNQDLMLVDTSLPIDLLNTSSELFVGLMQIILVTIAVVHTLAAIPVVFLVLFLIQKFYLRTSKQLRMFDLESKSALHTNLMETCSGLSTIRAFNWQGRVMEQHLTLLEASQEPFYLLTAIQRWLQLVLNLITAGIVIVVLGAAIALRDKVSPAALGVAFLNITTLGETITNFITSWTSLETSICAISRIGSFCRDTPTDLEPNKSQVPWHLWPPQGRIELRNVWLTYTSTGSAPVWALQDVNLKIDPGDKIAVCGRTGSGKSSLILALMSVVPPSSGSIVIDGIDIASVPGDLLRSRLQVVPQDSFIPSQALRDVLDPNKLLDDATVLDVLDKCGIADVVHSCGGLKGTIDSTTLSAGQAQLLCLARAILKGEASGAEGGVVILDEATSNVDNVTETKMQHLISTALAGKTVISVMHRLETAVKYDKIIVMDGGKVADFGTAEDVIRRCELFRDFRTNPGTNNTGELLSS